MKKLIKNLLRIKVVNEIAKTIKPVLWHLVDIVALIFTKIVTKIYSLLYVIDWGLPPLPEFFDHRIDLYYAFIKSRNPMWLERGIFNCLVIKRGGTILELCCGDGFYTRNFYSLLAKGIIAIDFDKKAIWLAKNKNYHPNIKYLLMDIRKEIPNGIFDNIIMDAALEHFTENEIFKLLDEIKKRLKPGAVFSGYTVVEKPSGIKQLDHHEYEFKNKEDLGRFLKKVFKYYLIFETIYPDRHNLYFYASDDLKSIPFSELNNNFLKNF